MIRGILAGTAFIGFLSLLSCALTAPIMIAEDYHVPDDYPENSVDTSTADRYERLLADATDGGFPGFAMLIDGPDGLWAGSGGFIDIANRINMEKNSLFRIGSTTKTYTAALVLDLVEDGFLSLHDTAASHLSEEIGLKIANVDQATIVHLLSHTSGIPEYFGFAPTGLDYAAEQLNHFGDFNLTREELVEFVHGAPASFAVGEEWGYSNTNYVLLALIAENVTGMSYPDLLRERIFLPLGLSNTYFEEEGNLPKGLARGYDAFYGDNRLYDVTHDSSGLGGDGGIITNTWDLAKFFRGLFDLSLFGQDLLDEMLTQYPFSTWGTDPVHASGYTLGLFYEATDGVADYYAHYGYVYGYGSDAYYFTRTDTLVILLSNMTNNPTAGEKTSPLRELMWSFGDMSD